MRLDKKLVAAFKKNLPDNGKVTKPEAVEALYKTIIDIKSEDDPPSHTRKSKKKSGVIEIEPTAIPGQVEEPVL